MTIKNYTHTQILIHYFNHLFFHRRPIHKLCFLSCRPFVVNATFSTGLVVSSVSCAGDRRNYQETKETKIPVANVALTTEDLQERKHNFECDDGGKIDN